jgi:hypothetical protein
MIDRHIAALKQLEGKKVEAGWFESDRYAATANESVGEPVAKIARINNYGATIKRDGKVVGIIPARGFMQGAWLAFSRNRAAIQKKAINQMLTKGKTPEQALGMIGNVLEGEIVKSIRDGGWEPNAPSTIAKKGFDKPLIDSGHMWKTVNSKVS